MASFPNVASINPSSGTTVSTAVITHPASVGAGELLLYCNFSQGTGYAGNAGGYTLLKGPTRHNSSPDQTIILGKVAVGTEGGTSPTVDVQFDPQGSYSAQLLRIQNWRGSLAGVFVSDGLVGRQAPIEFPLLTPPWGLADNLWLTLAGSHGVPAFAPTGYDFGQIVGSAICCWSAVKQQRVASDDPYPAIPWAGTQFWAGFTVAVAPPLVAQEGYRFRNDDGNESAATWKATQDVPAVMGLTHIASPSFGGPGTTTPRRAGINVTTGPLYIVAHIRPANATHTAAIISRFDTTPNRCVYLMLRSDGAVLFGWSEDGTTVVDINATIQWHSPTHSYPIEIGQAFWIAVSHNPTLATRKTKFFVAPTRELLPAHQLGPDVDWGSTGIIYDSPTTPWVINVRVDGGFHFVGDIYGVWAYAGLDETGIPLLSPDFSDPAQGWGVGDLNQSRGFDAQGNVWTVDYDHRVAGGVSWAEDFRLRTLMNAMDGSDPAGSVLTLMYKRVDEPDTEWRAV